MDNYVDKIQQGEDVYPIKDTTSGYIVDNSYVHTDNNFTNTLKTKVDGVAAGAQVNVIESVKLNGNALPVTNKSVNVTTPTIVQTTGTSTTSVMSQKAVSDLIGDVANQLANI